MIVVADTGPVIHLYWVGASRWALPPEPILVVREVWEEIERNAPEALADSRLVRADPPGAPPALLGSLDAGEAAAIALASTHPGCLVLCDDREARRVCAELSIRFIGSVGLIAQAANEGRIDVETAVTTLEALPTRGRLHVTADLIARAVFRAADQMDVLVDYHRARAGDAPPYKSFGALSAICVQVRAVFKGCRSDADDTFSG